MLDLVTNLRETLKSTWESMDDGPSEVDLGADLESIDGRFGVHSGYVLGFFGVHLVFCVGSILRSDSDSGLRPPRDQISGPLGPILALLLDPMLDPCWHHVGGRRASSGVLGRFWSDLKAFFNPFLVNMEH